MCKQKKKNTIYLVAGFAQVRLGCIFYEISIYILLDAMYFVLISEQSYLYYTVAWNT